MIGSDELTTCSPPVPQTSRVGDQCSSERLTGAWSILLVAVIVQLGFSAADQGIPLLTGFVKNDLGVSSTVAGLIVSSFLAGKVFGSYLAGKAADSLGEREILVGAGLVAGALIGIAAATPVAVMVPLLVAAGFVSAAGPPGGARLVLLAFPPSRRGLALGIRQTGIPLAGLLVALVLPSVARTTGWRWGLVVIAGIMLLAIVPLYMTAVAPQRTRDRLSDRRVRIGKIWNLRLLTIWGCLLVTGQYAVVGFLPLDLHESAGLTLPQAALMVAVAQAAGIPGRVVWAAMSDRHHSRGRKPFLLLLTGVGLLSAVLLFVLPRSAPLPVLFGVAAIAGISLIGYQGLFMTMVAETTGPAQSGAATGFAVTFVFAAAAVTLPLYGLVADVAGSFRAIWLALSVVLALAFAPALFLRADNEPGVSSPAAGAL